MKRITIIIVLAGLCTPWAGFAQLEKGNLLGTFSGAITYDHQKMSSDDWDNDFITNNMGVSLSEGIGFFVSNRLALGPGVTLSLMNTRTKTMDEGEATYEYNTLHISGLFTPYLRYYFAGNEKLAGFLQAVAKVGYGYWAYKDIESDQAEGSLGSLDYGGTAGLGMVYFLTPSIGLETQVFYDFQGSAITRKYEAEEADEDKYTQGIMTFGVNVGLNFYLQPKKKE